MTTQKARDEKRAEKYSYRFRNKYYYTAHLSGIRAERRRVVAAVKKLYSFGGLGIPTAGLDDVLKAIKGDRG